MTRLFILIVSAISFLAVSPDTAGASVETVSASAQIKSDSKVKIDKPGTDFRKEALRSYLEKHNSPLSEYAETFIKTADEYDLDWRLVPAITGVESTFGKRIPLNSHNAYGWANGNYYFESWEKSIEVVSRTLREKYYDNGATNINKVGRRYAPPSPDWAWKVKYFMNQIDPIPVDFDL